MATQFILKENVLTDDILTLADEGKVFKGQYIAIIREHSYLNPWSDKQTIKRFKTKETLDKYLCKKYPEFDYYN